MRLQAPASTRAHTHTCTHTRKIEKYELYNLIDDPNETKDLVDKNKETFEMMKQLVNKRKVDVQNDIIPWKGKAVLPYTVATWFNKNIPPAKIFKKLSAEEQDLMKSKQDSELLEYLQLHGVEDWEGYKAAEQECNHEVGD